MHIENSTQLKASQSEPVPNKEKPDAVEAAPGLYLFHTDKSENDNDYTPEEETLKPRVQNMRLPNRLRTAKIQAMQNVSRMAASGPPQRLHEARVAGGHMKKLPPFGKLFRPVPKTGVRVALGPGAWDFARTLCDVPNGWDISVMVLPEGEAASSFEWPSDGGPALVYEKGEKSSDQGARGRLTDLARELLLSGASSVVALRDGSMESDPRLFFDREYRDAA